MICSISNQKRLLLYFLLHGKIKFFQPNYSSDSSEPLKVLLKFQTPGSRIFFGSFKTQPKISFMKTIFHSNEKWIDFFFNRNFKAKFKQNSQIFFFLIHNFQSSQTYPIIQYFSIHPLLTFIITLPEPPKPKKLPFSLILNIFNP